MTNSRFLAGAAFAALLLGGAVSADEPLKSGPPVGSENDRRGFRPKFVAGPSAGKSLCPV